MNLYIDSIFSWLDLDKFKFTLQYTEAISELQLVNTCGTNTGNINYKLIMIIVLQ